MRTPPYQASLITGAAFFALILAVPGILADPDTLWQIHTGEWILANHAIPRTDPFSYTWLGQPWIAHEWLAETAMGLAHQIGGSRGVMALTALATGLTAGLLLFHLRHFMALLPAVVVMLLGMANTMGSLLARPHVLAWPCLELWCAGLALARGASRAPSWWLLPVMILWVNLHGSFILGLLLPLALLVEAAIEAGPNWRPVASRWARFTVLSWGVALINPDGIRALLFPFELVSMRNLGWIGEWTPADFSALRPLELTLLVLLGVGFLGRLTVPWLRLLMLLGLVHMALRHWRHDQLLGLIGVLLLAEAIGRLAPPPADRAKAPASLRASLSMGSGLLAATALAVRFLVPLAREPGEAVLTALDRLPASLRARPVLNDYGFGAGLIAHGDRPFIDSRANMYGDAFLGRFRAITDLQPGTLDAALAAFHIAWTIFPPDAPVVLALDARAGWHRLDLGPGVVVHVRDDLLPDEKSGPESP